MRLLNEVMGQIGEYYVNRDFDSLQTAIGLLYAEINDPQLQEAIISIPQEARAIEAKIATEGFLKFKMSQIDADLPVESGKLIRVVGVRQQEGTCMLMVVAHLDSVTETGEIILVPAPGGLDDYQNPD